MTEFSDLIELYFAKASKLIPFIHRPTCTAEILGPLVLNIMAAIGALYSDLVDAYELSISIAKSVHLTLVCCYSPTVCFLF